MKSPTVANVLNDPAKRMQYRVMAYRTLTRQELLQSVALYLRQHKGKMPMKGGVITIVSIIGFDGT